MKEIREYLAKHSLPSSVSLESVTIYEVSRDPTKSIFSSLASEHLPKDSTDDSCHLFVHFGVHGNATSFLLEQVAWNEMDFRVPDQSGFQPRSTPICDTDGAVSNNLACRLPLKNICESLCPADSAQPIVQLSTDPGRFLCNYLYYISLSETLKYSNAHSLFVHVPPFEAIDKDKQLAFIYSLLCQLCTAASQ